VAIFGGHVPETPLPEGTTPRGTLWMLDDFPCQLYDKEGSRVSCRDVVDQVSGDVVLFGELHNNAIAHRMEHELARDVYKVRKGKLILGGEMFEADNQLIINEYVAGFIKHNHLVHDAKVWDNYETDYRPLVEFAKNHDLPFVASNIPRRYASLVAREGIQSLENLSEAAKRFIAPLPIKVDMATPGYREIINISMSHSMVQKPENFVAAQAIKDATMAYFILKYFDAGSLFLHFNGDYHSRAYGGIYWYIKKSRPDLRVVIVSSVESESLAFQQEYEGLGDYVLVIPQSHHGGAGVAA
jgi:uncharacterized iron-regulated protein